MRTHREQNTRDTWHELHDPEHIQPVPRRASVMVLGADPADRMTLVTELLRDGYHVIEAHHEADLVDMAVDRMLHAQSTPGVDLVVADLRRHGHRGLHALALLRQAEWFTPLVVLLNEGDQEGQREAERLGAGALFVGRLDLDDFRMAVLNLVEPMWPA